VKVLKITFLFVATYLCLLVGSFVKAAEITVLKNANLPIILINGVISPGDFDNFLRQSNGLVDAAVALRGPGGSLAEALFIGELINKRGYMTIVGPSDICASACALIWLAGSQRAMTADSSIGFHAASLLEGDVSKVSSTGNAVVGAYLTQLGFNLNAVVYVTSAPPTEIRWLSEEGALKNGIEFILISKDEIQPHSRLSQLKLTAPMCWVVLASEVDLNAALRKSQKMGGHESGLYTVRTNSGYYAIVFGPVNMEADEDPLEQLKSFGLAPPDAFYSSGNGFLELIAR
jgi:membrane-bound ClpP family serine protease